MLKKAKTAAISSHSRWALITIFFLITVFSGYVNFGIIKDINPSLTVLSLFLAVFFHGIERYGLKNIVIFFLITWVVSHFFEALSIQTGFPFGHYYYDQLIGPRLFQVPLIIMFGYFGTGYASWILAHILLGQYHKKLAGKYLFLIPLVATFIMVTWDVCMDPISSTVASLWVWKDGGPYFGVPLQNYFGWFFVVYILTQLFAIYISRYDVCTRDKLKVFNGQLFWLEAVAVYGLQGLSQLMNPLTQTDHLDIYGCMAMLSIFTMLFITLISFLMVRKNRNNGTI